MLHSKQLRSEPEIGQATGSGTSEGGSVQLGRSGALVHERSQTFMNVCGSSSDQPTQNATLPW